MRKYEIHKAMYYYGLVLRVLDVIFSSNRKYGKSWVPPNQGFDVYKIAGVNLQQRLEGTKQSMLESEDTLQISICGLLLKPIGWKDGHSVGIGSLIEKNKEVRIDFYLRHPGITSLGPGWRFSMAFGPTRTLVKPIFTLPRGARESQELLALFSDKKHIII